MEQYKSTTVTQVARRRKPCTPGAFQIKLIILALSACDDKQMQYCEAILVADLRVIQDFLLCPLQNLKTQVIGQGRGRASGMMKQAPRYPRGSAGSLRPQHMRAWSNRMAFPCSVSRDPSSTIRPFLSRSSLEEIQSSTNRIVQT